MFNVVIEVVGEMKWLGFMKKANIALLTYIHTYTHTYTLFNLEFKVAKDKLVSLWASIS